MKICLISPLFDPWLVGGAEKYATALAKEMSHSFEVVVISTAGPTYRAEESIGDKLRIYELSRTNLASLYDIVTKSSQISPSRKAIWHTLDIWNVSVYRQVLRIIRDENPNLVHTNGIKGLSGSIFSAIKKAKKPHIHTLHDFELISHWSTLYRHDRVIDNYNPIDRIYIQFMRKISSTIQDVISPSQFVMTKHTELGYFQDAKRHVIPNGHDITTSPKPKQIITKDFLYVGQLVKHKGVQVAIEAFRLVNDVDARLHIVGDGNYLPELKSRAVDDPRIHFYGYLKDKKDLEFLYDKCSFFILPSIWYENFPLVVNEVMSRGLPVLGSDIGGLPELVQDGYNGFLFRPGDAHALFQLISSVITNAVDFPRLSSNAVVSASKYPITDQFQRIRNLYEQYK